MTKAKDSPTTWIKQTTNMHMRPRKPSTYVAQNHQHARWSRRFESLHCCITITAFGQIIKPNVIYCFPIILNVHYAVQTKAWFDEVTMLDWVKNGIAPDVAMWPPLALSQSYSAICLRIPFSILVLSLCLFLQAALVLCSLSTRALINHSNPT